MITGRAGQQDVGRHDARRRTEVRQTEVCGWRSDGRKFVDGGPMDGSLVGRAKVQRWQRCRLQRCNSNGGATRNAAVIAARARSDGVAAALTAALLRPYSVAAMAGSLRRCCGLAVLLQ